MRSIEKTFAVIETVVSEQELGLTFSTIVAMTGLPKASVHRILKGLTAMGYLTFNVYTKRYQGSLKLAAIGGDATARHNLGTYELDQYNTNPRAKRESLDKAIKHFTIAAAAGNDGSLKILGGAFRKRFITKGDYEKALRAHQKTTGEAKSAQREGAEADQLFRRALR